MKRGGEEDEHGGTLLWSQGVNGVATGGQKCGHRGSMVWSQGNSGVATGGHWRSGVIGVVTQLTQTMIKHMNTNFLKLSVYPHWYEVQL